jgi:hypothetical protein
MSSKTYNKDLTDKIKPGMTLWYAFFSVTGIDKSIAKLFVFTPDIITNNPVKDLAEGQGKDQN